MALAHTVGDKLEAAWCAKAQSSSEVIAIRRSV